VTRPKWRGLVIRLRPPAERSPAPNVRGHVRRFILAFAVLVAAGCVLLALPWTAENGEATPPIDALFTAVSAACVTGLVTVDTATHWNARGEVVILLLMQAGGLSFTVGASIILQTLRRGVSLRDTLLLRDGEPALSLHEALDLSRRILRFTLITEAIGAIVLAFGFWLDQGMAPARAMWNGLFLAVSAFCNASFDLNGGFASLSPYRTVVWLNLVVMVLIQTGALSYLVLSDVWEKRSWRRLTLDAKLVLLANAMLAIGGAVVFLGVEWSHSLSDTPGWARPMAALFQSVATRSGGFATVNLGLASEATLFVLMMMMAIGGAPGSTAGGARLTTVAAVAVAVVATLRGQPEPQVFGRRIPTPIIFRAMAVVALFGVAHFVATLALALTENVVGGKGLAFIALTFEAMSALSTNGLSTGITPALSAAGKIVLCATMFLGRVGPLAVVYALQKRQTRVRYRFPEASLRIG